ncbi:MmgE/PrpD family protein [Variovorax sp. SRS16]|uniref:MmgE/PrpD family protein n=1 Tax=Variovorax sp. SRS16 TaxID=282217 RepID=UPI0013A588E5|nr:MmgE/PrpD family protein [Variovorax sp. SRS16]
MTLPLTALLCEFVAETSALPASAQAMSRLCLLDWLGATVAGSAEPIAGPLLRTLEQIDAAGPCTVIGSPIRCSAPHAAMLNGTFSHVLELDDVHLQAAIHGSAPVWAAALAVAQWVGASADQTTLAFALGYEAMARIGVPCGQRMIAENHHPTGVLGYFGAAAAAGRLLKLDARQQAMAFGIAAGQAGASTQVRGTMSKPFFAGHSAHGGVLSALLASNGFVSAPDSIEGPQGTLATFCLGADLDPVVDGLGTRWELDRNAFKVHASCAMSHAIVDGILDLRARERLRADEVAAMRLFLYPHATQYLDRPRVNAGLEGKFSAQYCAAAALLDGVAQEGQFTDARAADAALRHAMDKVVLVPDAQYAMDQARVEITLRNGVTHSAEVLAVSGSPERPIGLDALETKFRQLAARALPRTQVERLLQSVRDWPSATVADLLRQTAR